LDVISHVSTTCFAYTYYLDISCFLPSRKIDTITDGAGRIFLYTPFATIVVQKNIGSWFVKDLFTYV